MAVVGAYLPWVVAAAAVVGGLLIAAVVPHNLRVWRARRAYRTLPDEVKDRVLELICRAASECPSVTFLRLDAEHRCEGPEVLLRSHVGGVPYAEVGDDWPTGDRAKFLLQVRLDEPSLGERWQGRLLTVFLVFDVEQVVRSYATPTLDRYVEVPAPAAALPCIPLASVRIPVEGDESHVPASPARLCEAAPAIRQLLGEFTNDSAGLLTQILHPGVYGYNLEEPDIAYAGGSPMLIQSPHDPTCDECGDPMRFLFQFGEVIPGMRLADGGVCYVYGCDRHPHRCKGFLDSH
jgi:hypothetical protein